MASPPPTHTAVAPSTPTRSRGADTAERILDAAEACFAGRGYAGTTLRDVAERVGIRIPSLYNHFPNKESLYGAVLERGMRPILELLTRFVAAGEASYRDPGEITAQVMELLGQRPNLPRLIQYELLAGGEHLAPLLEDWLRPTIAGGLALLENTGADSRWRPDQLPLLLLAFVNIAIGHFTTAPLFEGLEGESPLSQNALARQTEFFGQLTASLVGPEP